MTEKRLHLVVCAEERSCVPIASAEAPRPSSATPARWRRLAAADEIPADGTMAFMVNGVEVLVAHTTSGFLAVQALCPHEMVPLAVTGHLEGETLTCLEHLWQFDLRSGAPLGEALEGLQTYAIKNEGGQLYIAV